MPAQNESPPSTDPSESSPLQRALERLRPRLLAIPAEKIAIVPRVDPDRAIAIVNGSLARIARQRDGIAAELGEAAAAILDELPVAVHAAQWATVEAAWDGSIHDARALHEELFADHRLLSLDAEALAARGLLPRARVDAGRPAKGYRTVANSVLVLVSLFREHWPQLESKTAVTQDHLARLETRAVRALDILDRARRGRLPRPAHELRLRALVHLLDVYGEVRRRIQYVRYPHRDADEIAPSAYSGRHARANGRRASPAQPKAGAPSVPVVDPEVPSDA